MISFEHASHRDLLSVQDQLRSARSFERGAQLGVEALRIVFTNKLVPRSKVEALMPFVNLFKASTMELVNRGAIFSTTAEADPAVG
ncbi:MAG: hypothetical protein H0V44_10775 [Planctomycetes bacterium]|nr:hypothetical protein [Planctomycetota bacterium]